MNRRFPLFEVLLVAILLVTLVACGGGKNSSFTSGSVFNGTPAEDKITRGSFSLVPKGDLGADSFSLSVEELGNGEVRISVDATGASNLPFALFELLYDSTRYAPGEIEFSELFGADDVLTAGITTKPGNVGLAVVPVNYDLKPGVSGTGNIVTVSFKNEPFRTTSVGKAGFEDRETPAPIGHGNDVGETNFTGFHWREVLVGDGDFSGAVGVPDITPIALNYLAVVADSPEVEFVDYDANGSIGVPDITPIALNYLETIGGYNVYYQVGTSVFDPGTAILDGSSLHPVDGPGATKDAGGFIEHMYDFTNTPDNETWFYFVVPFNADGTEMTNIASAGFEVTFGEVIPPDLFDAFSIQVTGDLGFDDTFESETAGQTAGFIANGSYTFDLISAEIRKWNEATNSYDPAATIFPVDPDWQAAWDTNIAWQVAGTSDFTFDSATGSGAVGTCGPDDPFSFTVTATLNGLDCDVDVNVGADPGAPQLVALDPPKVEIPDIPTTPILTFSNMNDAGGTETPEAWLVNQSSGVEMALAFNATATVPGDLTQGQFFVEYSAPNPEHSTEHVLFFKAFAQVGTFKVRAKNRNGRTSSINSVTFTIEVAEPQLPGANLRIFPIQAGGNLSRIVITPSNPRVQLYPGIFREDIDPSKWRKYVRSSGDEFVPFRVFIGDPPNWHDTPSARIYTSDNDPFDISLITPTNPLGFDPSVPFIASTAIPETELGGGSAKYVTDWSVKEWNRLIVETKDNTIFPPDNDYIVAIFQFPSDWDNKVAIGKGTFRKQPITPPLADMPEILAFNEAHVAWSGGTAWPRIRYPDANGVFVDLTNPEVVDPAFFVIANNLRPDAWFNPAPANPYDSQRSSAIRFTRDANGDNHIFRVVPNEQPFAEIYLSSPKNSFLPTPEELTSNPPGYTPPTAPGIGDPEVIWDDNDPGWLVLPFTEFQTQMGIIFGLDPQAYLSVSVWNAAASGMDRWLNSDPCPVPATVILP